MYRIDDPSASTTLPTPEAALTEGYWTEGNPGTGVPATLERASWFNMVQEELRGIVVAGGLTPSKTTYTQVLTAIKALFVQVGQIATVQGAFKNLKIAPSSNTAVALTYDEGVLEATGGLYMTARSAALSISTASTGANALDTGAVAASTWYSVWDIYNPTTQTLAGLLSLSATAPTLPSGYTYKARRGWVRTNASSLLYRTIQLGRQAQYVVDGTILVAALPTMASGTAGAVNTPTWVAVAVGSFIPSTADRIDFIAGNQTAAAGSIIVAPNNSYGGLTVTGSNTFAVSTSSSFPLSLRGSFLLESTNIYWASNLAGNALSCLGWEDNL